MPEIWKDVKGYEGLYKVSNTGKIYSCKNQKILSQHPKPIYYRVALSKDGQRRDWYVHRLVAETFIPNPENKKEVNHIDQNPHNNNANNLEWATPEENMNAYYKSGKLAETLKKSLETKDKIGKYKDGLAFQLFGKRAKDLTKEEYREYKRIQVKRNRKERNLKK